MNYALTIKNVSICHCDIYLWECGEVAFNHGQKPSHVSNRFSKTHIYESTDQQVATTA